MSSVKTNFKNLKIVNYKLENNRALKPKTYLPYVSKRWRAQTTLIGLLYLQYIVSDFCWCFKRKYRLSLAQFLLFLKNCIILINVHNANATSIWGRSVIQE